MVTSHDVVSDMELNLLSYNMQAGFASQRYSDYVTSLWRYVFPTSKSLNNLQQISDLVSPFDMVGLQEVDAGSLRSGFINQLDLLAERSNFDFSTHQLNRNFGKLGQFGNGFLSRHKPIAIEDHKLPGVKGRGAMLIKMGDPNNPFVVLVMHLALTQKTQIKQLDYAYELLSDYDTYVIMGDFNCDPYHFKSSKMNQLGLQLVNPSLPTYPSWRPQKHIDHIWISDNIDLLSSRVIQSNLSDHLPAAIKIKLPDYYTGSMG